MHAPVGDSRQPRNLRTVSPTPCAALIPSSRSWCSLSRPESTPLSSTSRARIDRATRETRKESRLSCVAVTRRLRYSERKRLAESGSLGDLVHDVVPQPLVHATLHFVDQARGKGYGLGPVFARALDDACIAHTGGTIGKGSHAVASLLNPETYLDFAEIVVEQGAIKRPRSSGMPSAAAWSDAPDDLNALWDRHRFGFRFEGNEVRRIGSPVLFEEVIVPALTATQREGWGEVERSYREAILHQRGPSDENDDALTAASAALEAALKAVGLTGSHLGPLAASFKASNLAHPQVAETPELLTKLMQRVGAIRNEFGDSHGKHDGAPPVPQELADLAVHWTGAFIVYLGERQDSAR